MLWSFQKIRRFFQLTYALLVQLDSAEKATVSRSISTCSQRRQELTVLGSVSTKRRGGRIEVRSRASLVRGLLIPMRKSRPESLFKAD